MLYFRKQMAKIKSTFFCKNCGAESSKWIGKCPSCNEWNTYIEERITKQDTHQHSFLEQDRKKNIATLITDVPTQSQTRLITPDTELNRVLGGGIVPGSLVLIGGEPGIGKSTLLLQVALQIEKLKTFYISGEESEQQIKMRAERIQAPKGEVYLYTETSTHQIFKQLKEYKPDLVIIDSIQTLYTDNIESTPGSISQIRECTGELMRYAKETQIPVFIIGHITKDGAIAGPKVLEHMVDTVLQFEGDRHHTYRILRTIKNRFGSTSELGIYEMLSSGLRIVSNPSEVLLSQRDIQPSGVAVAAMMEGVRPILIETQALVSNAVYGTPQRSATGFDLRRLHMLLAVLEKRCGFRIGMKDVFVNIAGGLRVEDPAVDLALIAALISSYDDVVISAQSCFAAEVGLSGEIRAINRLEQRITEAERLGFKKIFVSKYNLKGIKTQDHEIEIVGIAQLTDILK